MKHDEKCPNCGKYVPKDDGYVTPDWPEWEHAPFRACCDKECSDLFENKWPEQVAEWNTVQIIGAITSTANGE
jgi:hypothetical protein